MRCEARSERGQKSGKGQVRGEKHQEYPTNKHNRLVALSQDFERRPSFSSSCAWAAAQDASEETDLRACNRGLGEREGASGMWYLGTGSAKSRVTGRKRCIWAGLWVRRREGSGMRKRLARRIFLLQRSAKKNCAGPNKIGHH